jgi:hypothetical protein
MENGTIPAEIFPVDKTDPTVTTEGPKKDFPVERTLGIVGHLKTYARSRLWRYVNKEVPGMGPGSIGRDACLFFDLDSKRPTAFDIGTNTWAVWAGDGPPDCEPFETYAPETEKVAADETTTCVGDVKVPPAGSVQVTMGDGTRKWMAPKELQETIAKQVGTERAKEILDAVNEPSDTTRRVAVGPRPPVYSVRDTFQRIKELEHARSGFTTIPQKPLTPAQLHEFGIEIYRAGRALTATATKLNLTPWPSVSTMLQEMHFASNKLHARASELELEAVRKALDSK